MGGGFDIPYEAPKSPDLVIESDKSSPEEMLEIIWSKIGGRIFSNPNVKSQYQMRSKLCVE